MNADANSIDALRKKHIWIVVSVLFAAFMSKLDVYIVNISLPSIALYFNTTPSVVARTVLAYLIVGTSTLLFFGKLGDRFGQKRVFIAGYAVFTLGSLMCGISPTMNILVISRVFQGLGAAMLISAAYAIIPKHLPGEINGWAFGILSLGAALGIAVGAPVGGFINRFMTWHWVFLINVPVGIIAIIMSWKMIPPEKTRETKINMKEFDIPGTLLSLSGLSLLLYAINTGHSAGWTSARVLLPILFSIILIALFCIWELKSATPILDFTIFKDRRFVFATLSGFFGLAVLGGSSFIMPFYLELGKKLDSMTSGFILMSFSIGYVVVAPIAGRLADRIQPSLLSAAGMTSLVFAAFFFSQTLAIKGLAFSIIYLIWLSVSFAVFFSPNNSFVMSIPSEDRKGMASGCYNAIGAFGTAMGVAVFETVFSFGASRSGTLSAIISKTPAAAAYGCKLAFIAGMMLAIIAAVFSGLNIKYPHHHYGAQMKRHFLNLHH